MTPDLVLCKYIRTIGQLLLFQPVLVLILQCYFFNKESVFVLFHLLSPVFTLFYFGYSTSRVSRYDKGHTLIFLSYLYVSPISGLEVLCYYYYYYKK